MKKIISTQNAPAAVGPYSQAVMAGDTLYISGQIAIDPTTGQIASTIEEQTTQILKNIDAILSEAGMTKANVVKTSVLLDDLNDFAAMNAIYASYFTEDMPARACYEVSKLPLGVKIEIESIAYKG
ncbi:MAG: RidA family protein [Rikenellaceae bacterium]